MCDIGNHILFFSFQYSQNSDDWNFKDDSEVCMMSNVAVSRFDIVHKLICGHVIELTPSWLLVLTDKENCALIHHIITTGLFIRNVCSLVKKALNLYPWAEVHVLSSRKSNQ